MNIDYNNSLINEVVKHVKFIIMFVGEALQNLLEMYLANCHLFDLGELYLLKEREKGRKETCRRQRMTFYYSNAFHFWREHLKSNEFTSNKWNGLKGLFLKSYFRTKLSVTKLKTLFKLWLFRQRQTEKSFDIPTVWPDCAIYCSLGSFLKPVATIISPNCPHFMEFL